MINTSGYQITIEDNLSSYTKTVKTLDDIKKLLGNGKLEGWICINRTRDDFEVFSGPICEARWKFLR